ncbi:TPA: hypothetical protein PX766_003457 [Vibrio cholerae]|nr:hypothetical protein [Vibrio cholerae]MVC39971.1 hypothetical protein [Vibrio cholerae]HDL9443377.1 hypothetical protein [Vibrio cholerae]
MQLLCLSLVVMRCQPLRRALGMRRKILPKKYKTKLSFSTALNKLQQFLDRVEYWNTNYSKYYRVSDVVLLGSLARSESKVGDLDLCVNIERVQAFSPSEKKEEYSEWRSSTLGYAHPSNYGDELYMFQTDVIRFIKAGDGRFVLQWHELPSLSLTLDPLTKLVSKGELQYSNAREAVANATCLSGEEINSTIEKGALSRKDYEISVYRNALSKYPEHVRDAILERDKCQDEYYAHIGNHA